MQKITEIKETYTVKRKEKINGIETTVSKQFTRFKPVNYVSGWSRFGHYLLDGVFIYAFNLMIGFLLGIIIALTSGRLDMSESRLENIFTISNWLIFTPLFYFIFEASMQASPAKAILKRVVVDEYGNKPTMKQIFIRSISRVVPFESFSCLNETGWHDNWSKTFVIRKKDLEELRLLQKIHNINGQETPSEVEQK